MALYNNAERYVDYLRSYLLVCFGQVLNNLTSLTLFKTLAYFSAEFLE